MAAAPPPSTSLRAHLLVALFALGLAGAVVAPIFQFPDRWAWPYDWLYFETTEEVARTTVADYGEAPLWNPYMCGGEVALANPQSTTWSPNFLLSLAAGTPLGLKLGLVLLLFCAIHGTFLVSLRLGTSLTGALFAAAAYGTCGWFAMHLSQGHPNFGGAALYPYLLYAYRRAVDDDLRYSLFAAAIVAWLIGLGGTYTVPLALLLLGTVTLSDVIADRSLRPVAVAALTGLFAAGFAAPRLLPLLEFVRHHPRHVAESDSMNALDLLRAFFAWRQTLAPVDGHVYWWHEYCCHLPYLAFPLALVGALRPFDDLRARRWELLPAAAALIWALFTIALPDVDRWLGRHILFYRDAYHLLGVAALLLATRRGSRPGARFAPVFIVALGIAVGRAWPYGPWWLLRKLPVFEDLRVPPRYLILAALPLCLWAGCGLDELRRFASRLPRWLGERRLAAALFVVATVEGIGFAVVPYLGVFTQIGERTTAPGARQDFHQERGDIRWMLGGVLNHFGTLDCDEEAPLQRGELDSGHPRDGVDQVRLLDPSAGTIAPRDWSPNRLVFTVDLARPTDVIVNQNWNEHWTSHPGEVKSVAGRLAAAAPAGRYELTLRYRPRSYDLGRRLFAVALLLAMAMALAPLLRRRRGAHGG